MNFHFCGRIPFDNLQHYFVEGISFFNAIPYTIFIIIGRDQRTRTCRSCTCNILDTSLLDGSWIPDDRTVISKLKYSGILRKRFDCRSAIFLYAVIFIFYFLFGKLIYRFYGGKELFLTENVIVVSIFISELILFTFITAYTLIMIIVIRLVHIVSQHVCELLIRSNATVA